MALDTCLYPDLITASTSSTPKTRSLFQVGRALRAVDPRLKMEWMRWAEGAALSCDGRMDTVHHGLHPPGNGPPPTSKVRATTGQLEGLARTSRGGTTPVCANWYAEASLNDPSARMRGSPQRRRRRRLRAWCSKVCAPETMGRGWTKEGVRHAWEYYLPPTRCRYLGRALQYDYVTIAFVRGGNNDQSGRGQYVFQARSDAQRAKNENCSNGMTFRGTIMRSVLYRRRMTRRSR